MKVIRQCEANVELDGPEVVRTYLETGKITFGSSTLLPGQTGGIDPGHPQSHEVFFVSRGHVIMRNTNTMKCFELNELTNIGMGPAVITWSCAPSHIK